MSGSAVYNLQQETEERTPAEHPFTARQAGVSSFTVYSGAFFPLSKVLPPSESNILPNSDWSRANLAP